MLLGWGVGGFSGFAIWCFSILTRSTFALQKKRPFVGRFAGASIHFRPPKVILRLFVCRSFFDRAKTCPSLLFLRQLAYTDHHISSVCMQLPKI
jgi:hypothetical protein